MGHIHVLDPTGTFLESIALREYIVFFPCCVSKTIVKRVPETTDRIVGYFCSEIPICERCAHFATISITRSK